MIKRKPEGSEKPFAEKSIMDSIRSGLAVYEKMRGKEKEEAVSSMRKVITDRKRNDKGRIEAASFLEIIDKNAATEIYLELFEDRENSAGLRCTAMAFFVKDRSFFENTKMVEKIIFALSRISNDYTDENDAVRKQAEATLWMVFSRRFEEGIPKKSRTLLSEYAEY